MSHTSEISSVAIVDIQALEATVADLNKQGIKCSLQRNAVPRAFYQNQEGLGLAPFVLKLNDCPYDVGFYENGKGGYSARTDLWMGHVAKLLGVTAKDKETTQQAALGKLFHGYAVNAALRQAARQGYRVTKSVKADGSVQLIMNV